MPSQVAGDMRESRGWRRSPAPLRISFAARSLLDAFDNEREEEQKRDTAKEHRGSLFGLP